MKIFTICSGQVKPGVLVKKLLIQGTDTEIAAITVGKETRNNDSSYLGILPVILTDNLLKKWQTDGVVEVFFVQVSTTRVGESILLAQDNHSGDNDQIVGVFLTDFGFCGGNDHTGEEIGQEPYRWFGETRFRTIFASFPGQVLVTGAWAKSALLSEGCGQQLIAIMPQGVFRTAYSGKLFGSPSEHYYHWDGKELVGGLTKDEWLVRKNKLG